jgi:plasmid replication initiation protein
VPELVRLESNFTSYELEQVAELTSAYAVRLYELLIQWRVAGKTPVFELAQFRMQLGLGIAEYASMGDFKKRVLDYALAQINEKTDITASYEQHKTGRNITGFSFKFKPKGGRKVSPKSVQRDANTPDFFTQLTDKQIDLLVRSDLFLADFHQLYGSSDDYATARGKLRKKLIEAPEQFGKFDFERYK